MDGKLTWPLELANPNLSSTLWQQAGSNICLDFHGDPTTAKLVVFSDGNHHMALQEVVEKFLTRNPEVLEVFYATTPPNVLVSYLDKTSITLGNLRLSCTPHVFISPESVMDKLADSGFIKHKQAFIKSRGNVLLVKKGNPKNIVGIDDLLRDNVRLFISNPQTEKASYEVYRNSILGLARQQDLDVELLTTKLSSQSNTTIFGECIHHREAPQAIYADLADVAMVYYHLALRYHRTFHDALEFVALGGDIANPQPGPENITTTYYVALIKGGGTWGQSFVDFLVSDAGIRIYQSHGLAPMT